MFVKDKSRIKVYTGIKESIYCGIKVAELSKSPIHVPVSYVQRYSGTSHAMKGLTRIARSLMDYMVDEMDVNNEVTFIQKQKLEFTEFIRSDGKDSIKMSSIESAMQELKKGGLIISVFRGCFLVNPLYFTKGIKKKIRLDRLSQTINAEFIEKHQHLFIESKI